MTLANWMHWAKAQLTALIRRVRKPDPVRASPPPLPPTEPPPIETPVKVPSVETPEGVPVETSPKKTIFSTVNIKDAVPTTRQELSALERRRRKHDKFVEPKGIKPAPAPKVERFKKPKAKPAPVEDLAFTDAELAVYGHHHEDNQDVLYKEAEFYGEFNFRDTILQQLERYFVYLARMKKHDPDAYNLYRQVGATLLPYITTGAHDMDWKRERDESNNDKPSIELADWFNHQRPAFGCFVYGANPEVEKHELNSKNDTGQVLWSPKFMYYTKYNRAPPNMQPMTRGSTYIMTVYWDRPHDPLVNKKMKYGVPNRFGIHISEDGKQLQALLICDTEMVRIKPRNNRRKAFSVPHRYWHLPTEFANWAKDRGQDPEKFLIDMFLESVQKQEHAQYAMVRVSVSKDDMTAVFGLNVHRTGYFFQDRDYDLNKDGHRKRVFHVVRAHERSDGSVVKMHFRGEKEFIWAGYKVKITVPDASPLDMANFDCGCDDEFWLEGGKEQSYDIATIGAMIASKNFGVLDQAKATRKRNRVSS